MPAPVPKFSSRLAGRRVRGGEERADAHRQPRPAGVGVDVADRAAVGAARHRLQLARSPAGARIFGAPVTDPGGKVAARISGPADAAASRAGHGGHQVRQPGVLLPRQQLGDQHRAGPADPPQVVADQVGDHDVLRKVLVRERFPRPGGALDRRRGDAHRRPGDRNSSGEAVTIHSIAEVEHALVRRRVAGGQQARPAPADRHAAGSGADSSRQRFTW